MACRVTACGTFILPAIPKVEADSRAELTNVCVSGSKTFCRPLPIIKPPNVWLISTVAGAMGGAPLPPLEPVLLLISTRCISNPKQTLLAPFSFGDLDQWTGSRLVGN